MGAADIGGLGLADEGAAGLGYLLDKLPGGQGRDYSKILEEINRNQDAAFNQNPGSYRVGEGAGIAAGIAGGAINAGVRGAAAAAPTLGRMAMDGLKFGAGLGAVSGFGSGRDLPERVTGAITGAAAGGSIGAGAPYAISRLGNERLSDKDYLQAINDLEEVVKAGLARAKVQAGQGGTSASPSNGDGWTNAGNGVKIRVKQ
jgi:hypothetical protein